MAIKFTAPIKAGSPADQVKAVQRVLYVTETGDFGPTTKLNVENFQSKHALTVTGVVDQATWNQMFQPKDFGDVALKHALAENGVHESGGPNRGPRVDLYNATVGTAPGSHWCLSFVFFCCVQAAKELGRPIPIPKTAYCPTLLGWAHRNGRLTSNPEAGDIFLLKGEGTAIHTGFVIGPDPKDKARVLTIEGNTNDDGSTNGIKVCKRSRRRDSLYFVTLE